MARTKKTPSSETKIELKESEDILTPEEVKEVVFNFQEFAQQFNRGNGIYNQILNPLLINSRMKDISLNPLVATEEKLNQALISPKESELELLGFSEYFEIISQPYKRMLEYLSSMLSWDLTYTCVTAEKEDYKTVAYKKALSKMESMLERFDYQKEFSVVTKELLRNEAYFCSPRFDSDQIVLQELPSSPTYTKITGRFSHGLLFSFNMQWFIQPGVDINMYDPFFAESYSELMGAGSVDGYRGYWPSTSPLDRGNSFWVYWQDIPVDVGWAWKMSPEIATRVPHFTGLFSDLVLQPLMRTLQKNTNMASAHKILAGEVGFLKDTGAKVKDALTMSPETLARFLQLVSSSLNAAIKVAAAPLNNVQGISFPGDNDLYPEYLKNMLATSGLNTNLIFTSDVRPNQLESQLSLNSDEQLMTALYPQFNSFMNYKFNIDKKFKWKFEFQGTNFFTNRAERFDRQTGLMQNGIVLPQQISAAVGIRYSHFKKQMEEADAEGFVDKLTPILQAAQISKDGAGRPSTPDNKIGDAGAQTREQGSNVSKGGKK